MIKMAAVWRHEERSASAGSVTFVQVLKALAAFERTLISGNSPYDRYRYARDENAISSAAKRGEDLFFHMPYGCSHCHGGFTWVA